MTKKQFLFSSFVFQQTSSFKQFISAMLLMLGSYLYLTLVVVDSRRVENHLGLATCILILLANVSPIAELVCFSFPFWKHAWCAELWHCRYKWQELQLFHVVYICTIRLLVNNHKSHFPFFVGSLGFISCYYNQ